MVTIGIFVPLEAFFAIASQKSKHTLILPRFRNINPGPIIINVENTPGQRIGAPLRFFLTSVEKMYLHNLPEGMLKDSIKSGELEEGGPITVLKLQKLLAPV